MIKQLYNYIRERYIRSFKNGIRVSRKATVFGTKLDAFVHVGDYALVYESKLGSYTSIGRNTVIRNSTLGRFCSISWHVTVGAIPHNYNLMSTHAFHYIESFGFVDQDKRIVLPTNLGNDVWVGANAIIMPGLTIGDGAVIGAGAVVTKDVPPYAIVAGVPAKIIKFRFEEEVVSKLIELAWWNWHPKIIKANIELFRSPMDIEAFFNIKDA